MGTLLIDGTLSGAKGGKIIKEAYSENIFYAAFLLGFVILANVTMMGVLGGLLVRTVATTADVEKEEKSMQYIVEMMESLWEMVIGLDTDLDGQISHSELCNLVQDVQACRMLQSTGVDLDGLVNLSGSIFRQHGGSLNRGQFTSMLLDLRGKNVAKVKDHVETR